MKIIHVSPYYPPHLGGLQEAVKNLATAQALNGHEVSVITSRKPKASGAVPLPAGVTIHRLRAFEVGHTPIMPSLLFSLVRRARPGDVVHVHFAQAYVTEVAALYSRLTGRPFIVHYHGDSLPSGVMGKLLPLYKRYVLSSSLRRAAAVIFPSDDFKDRIIRQFPFLGNKPTFVIPNGIQPPDEQTTRLGNKFLYAGRLSSIKNVDHIIAAFVHARAKAPDIELDIVGDGLEEAHLRELVHNLNAGPYIHFLGNLDKDEVDKRYLHSMVLLVASGRESFGLSIAEAMAAGLPVVAFDTPGVSRLVKHRSNGLLVPAFDIHQYAGAIVELAGSRGLRRDLGDAATISVRPFDYLKVATQYDQVNAAIFHPQGPNQDPNPE